MKSEVGLKRLISECMDVIFFTGDDITIYDVSVVSHLSSMYCKYFGDEKLSCYFCGTALERTLQKSKEFTLVFLFTKYLRESLDNVNEKLTNISMLQLVHKIEDIKDSNTPMCLYNMVSAVFERMKCDDSSVEDMFIFFIIYCMDNKDYSSLVCRNIRKGINPMYMYTKEQEEGIKNTVNNLCSRLGYSNEFKIKEILNRSLIEMRNIGSYSDG